MRISMRNPVLFVLVLIAILACLFTGFLTDAPNRLVSGRALMLWQVTGAPIHLAFALLAAALLALSWTRATRAATTTALAIAGAFLLLFFFAAGHCASILMAESLPATRIALGPAFWIAIFCLAMAMLDALQRMAAGAAARFLVVGILVLALAAMNAAGLFDQLSIMREYASRREVFASELAR